VVVLLGRESELTAIAGVASQAPAGGSWLNIVGPPGIGKSALLLTAAEQAAASGFTIVQSTCTQSEEHLGFAALHQLLRPLLGGLEQLPAGHSAALRTAFGLDHSVAGADPFHVALAALELLADAAAIRPVLAVVDDIHWCDRPSLSALGFVGRRIAAEPIVLLTGTRPGTAEADTANLTITLDPLQPDAAAQLLHTHSPALPAKTAAQILALAGGNPLALQELPRALHRGGGDGRREVPTLTSRLENAFGDRVSQLSAQGQLVLLVAALQDGDSVDDTVRAAEILVPEARPHLAEAAANGVIVLTPQTVRFAHPLTRSAVVQRSDLLLRQRVHAALAETLAQSSPERATWHRSAALSTPDDALAAELEVNAEAACAAGRTAAAIPWSLRAAELTTAPADRGRRLLRTAEMSFEIGDHQSVAELTAQARVLPLQASDAARLAGLDSAFDDGVPGDAGSVERLTQGARVARATDQQELAASLLIVAVRSQYWRGALPEQSDPIRAELSALGLDADDPRRLHGTALLDPYEKGGLIAEQLTQWSARGPVEPSLGALLALAAFVAGDFDQALQFARSASTGLRQEGRITLLAQTLVLEAFSSLYLGRWDIAFAASHEARRFAEETKQPMWAACAMLGQGNVAALRGDHDTATQLADSIEAIGYVTSNAALINGVQLLRGLTALGKGDSAAAFEQLNRMFDRSDPAYHSPQCAWAVDYLAEAARGCRRLEDGREILGAMQKLVADTPALGIRRAIALAGAWLADDEDEQAGEAAFANAEHLSALSPAWYRARLALARGMRLRRRQQSVTSRGPLRDARNGFASLGASAWAERAEQELSAAGQHSPDTTTAAWPSLSAQELLIAQRAAQGLTNREIGSELYLSHRTVGSHLYRVFPKLGIRHRAQLSEALRVLDATEPTE
jgi:DNA-binding CsgD family transcriptional regulator